MSTTVNEQQFLNAAQRFAGSVTEALFVHQLDLEDVCQPVDEIPRFVQTKLARKKTCSSIQEDSNAAYGADVGYGSEVLKSLCPTSDIARPGAFTVMLNNINTVKSAKNYMQALSENSSELNHAYSNHCQYQNCYMHAISHFCLEFVST